MLLTGAQQGLPTYGVVPSEDECAATAQDLALPRLARVFGTQYPDPFSRTHVCYLILMLS